jgi:pimeloyl-ACP methyl ester carboxylesterase
MAAVEFPVVPYEEWDGRGQYAALQDGSIFYVREGNGFPLVLLHMFGGNSWWFSRVLSCFAGAFDVIALDLPGCAHSDTPPLPYDVPDVADAIVQFLDTLGLERVHFAAIGGGSLTALHIATTWPARVGKLVLEALPHWTRREAIAHWRNDIEGRWLDENYDPRPYEEWGDMERSYSPLDAPTRMLAVERAVEDYREHGRWWGRSLVRVAQLRYDVNPRLAAIAAPTLLIYGSAVMEIMQQGQREVAQAIPDARLEIVPGARTTSPFDRPELYAPLVLDFLAEGPG